MSTKWLALVDIYDYLPTRSLEKLIERREEEGSPWVEDFILVSLEGI